MGAKIAVAIACVALITQTIITTELGIKLSSLVEVLAGGNLVIALILTMFLSILLGLGIPTSAAYALVAIVVAPVLVRMGVNPIAAHYFAFYAAVKSAITPPVALASLAACSISGGGYWKTSMEAFRLGISGLIIPYLIIFNPVLVLQPLDPVWSSLSLVAIPLGLIAFTGLVYNYLITRLNFITWLWVGLATIGLFGYAFTKNYALFSLGMFAFVTVFCWQWRLWRKNKDIEMRVNRRVAQEE